MTRLATLVCTALLSTACAAQAGSEPAPTRASGKLVLTERDHGRTVTMRVGRTGSLLVPSRLRGEVKAIGRAALLIRVETFAPSASQMWELRAKRVGSTVLTGPRRDGSRFRITLRVLAPA